MIKFYYIFSTRKYNLMFSNNFPFSYLIKFYFIDDVSNGAMNFVMWDVDILGETADVKYYELHSGN